MARSSRKDRKVQRERAQRATDRGLPALAPEAYKSPVRGQVLAAGPHLPDDSTETNGDLASSNRSKGWLSRWSLWAKVLGLTILVLLGISLWRTIASKTGQ